MKYKRFTKELIQRFWSYVSKTSDEDCWIWLGGKSKNYGMFSLGRDDSPRLLMAHRVSYAIHNDLTPQELPKLLRHTCDNPSCVNPHHLLGGTHKDNTRDMFERGREVICRGEKNGSAKLTQNQVEEIRNLLSNGKSANSIAKLFGVSHTLINGIRDKKYWNTPN